MRVKSRQIRWIAIAAAMAAVSAASAQNLPSTGPVPRASGPVPRIGGVPPTSGPTPALPTGLPNLAGGLPNLSGPPFVSGSTLPPNLAGTLPLPPGTTTANIPTGGTLSPVGNGTNWSLTYVNGIPYVYTVVGVDPARSLYYTYYAPIYPNGVVGPPQPYILYNPPGRPGASFAPPPQTPYYGGGGGMPWYGGAGGYGAQPSNANPYYYGAGRDYSGFSYSNSGGNSGFETGNGYNTGSGAGGMGTNTANTQTGSASGRGTATSTASAIPAGAVQAIVDIQEAWTLGRSSLLTDHLGSGQPVQVYVNGVYQKTVSPSDYETQIRKDLVEGQTQSLVLDQRVALPGGVVGAWGKHVFYDQNNQKQTSYVGYWLQQAGNRWVVFAVNSASDRGKIVIAPRPRTATR